MLVPLLSLILLFSNEHIFSPSIQTDAIKIQHQVKAALTEEHSSAYLTAQSFLLGPNNDDPSHWINTDLDNQLARGVKITPDYIPDKVRRSASLLIESAVAILGEENEEHLLIDEILSAAKETTDSLLESKSFKKLKKKQSFRENNKNSSLSRSDEERVDTRSIHRTYADVEEVFGEKYAEKLIESVCRKLVPFIEFEIIPSRRALITNLLDVSEFIEDKFDKQKPNFADGFVQLVKDGLTIAEEGRSAGMFGAFSNIGHKTRVASGLLKKFQGRVPELAVLDATVDVLDPATVIDLEKDDSTSQNVADQENIANAGAGEKFNAKEKWKKAVKDVQPVTRKTLFFEMSDAIGDRRMLSITLRAYDLLYRNDDIAEFKESANAMDKSKFMCSQSLQGMMAEKFYMQFYQATERALSRPKKKAVVKFHEEELKLPQLDAMEQ